MKAILVVIFALAIFEASCGNPDPKITGVSVENTNPQIPIPMFGVNGKTYPIQIGSDGHNYYFLEVGVGGYCSRMYPFHYPGCKLCESKDSTILSLLTKQK